MICTVSRSLTTLLAPQNSMHKVSTHEQIVLLLANNLSTNFHRELLNVMAVPRHMIRRQYNSKLSDYNFQISIFEDTEVDAVSNVIQSNMLRLKCLKKYNFSHDQFCLVSKIIKRHCKTVRCNKTYLVFLTKFYRLFFIQQFLNRK